MNQSNPKFANFYINKILYPPYYTGSLSGSLNQFIDIKYSELNFTYRDNQIYFVLKTHVINNFSLPYGFLTAKLTLFNKTFDNLPLIKTNDSIPLDFAYGIPALSNVYIAYGSVAIDLADSYFLTNNSTSINLTFGVDQSKLPQISQKKVDPNVLNSFLNELSNLHFLFKYNFQFVKYLDNANDQTYQYSLSLNHTTQLISYYSNSDPTNTNWSEQNNNDLPIMVLLPKLVNLKNGFTTLFTIKNDSNVPFHILIQSIKIRYLLKNKLYSVAKYSLNQTIDLNTNYYAYQLNTISLMTTDNVNYNWSFATNKNQGIYFNGDVSGKYLVNFAVIFNGFTKTYQITNLFSFNNSPIFLRSLINFTHNENSDALKIANSDSYYEISK